MSWESKAKGLLDDQDAGVNLVMYYLLMKSAYTAAEITGLFYRNQSCVVHSYTNKNAALIRYSYDYC